MDRSMTTITVLRLVPLFNMVPLIVFNKRYMKTDHIMEKRDRKKLTRPRLFVFQTMINKVEIHQVPYFVKMKRQ